MTHTAEHARRGMAAVALATDRLIAAVGGLEDADVRKPSQLPGWSRAHVISHLARNADALVNLLIWARTGVEHPMYTSRDDRDAAIDEGAGRGRMLLTEDLVAACQRLAFTADALPDGAWSAVLSNHRRQAISASDVPWLRAREVWIHLVDLDVGVGFDDIPAELHEELIDDAVRQYRGRTGLPPLVIETELVDGSHRSWQLDGAAGPTVHGGGADLLAWLTGRSSGSGLTGPLPALPPWS